MILLHVSERPGSRPLDYDQLSDTPDLNLAWALGARRTVGLDVYEPSMLCDYDAVLFSMRKTPLQGKTWMHEVAATRDAWCDNRTILVYQEAEWDWPTWRPESEVRDLQENLSRADLFLAHTHDGAAFFGAFAGVRAASVPTLLRLDRLPAPKPPERKVAILGTPDARARGLAAFVAAAECVKGEREVLLNRDGAKGSERRLEVLAELFGGGCECLPYLPWRDYAEALNGSWVFVSAMTAAAAGRDAILAAALGIPFVGTVDLDAVKDLHPRTGVRTTGYLGLRNTLRDVLAWSPQHRETFGWVLKERAARYDLSKPENVEAVRRIVEEALP